MYDEWSSATAYDDPSTIGFGILPKGARVLGFMVSWDAQGAAVVGGVRIGEVAATGTSAITDMTSAGELWIPVLASFMDTPLTADSVVDILTATQALGQNDKICMGVLYLDED
jgi:hypothetical protein